MKKAKEIYGHIKGLFLQPQVVPPPVKRRMLAPSAKLAPSVTDYANKVHTTLGYLAKNTVLKKSAI